MADSTFFRQASIILQIHDASQTYQRSELQNVVLRKMDRLRRVDVQLITRELVGMMALIQSFLASLKTWSFLFSLVYRTGAVS
jgi:hypothetical protein